MLQSWSRMRREEAKQGSTTWLILQSQLELDPECTESGKSRALRFKAKAACDPCRGRSEAGCDGKGQGPWQAESSLQALHTGHFCLHLLRGVSLGQAAAHSETICFPWFLSQRSALQQHSHPSKQNRKDQFPWCPGKSFPWGGLLSHRDLVLSLGRLPLAFKGSCLGKQIHTKVLTSPC